MFNEVFTVYLQKFTAVIASIKLQFVIQAFKRSNCSSVFLHIRFHLIFKIVHIDYVTYGYWSQVDESGRSRESGVSILGVKKTVQFQLMGPSSS